MRLLNAVTLRGGVESETFGDQSSGSWLMGTVYHESHVGMESGILTTA